MYGRLSFEAHQTARTLGREAADGNSASHAQLRVLIRREHPDMGERWLCPSGQTVADYADAVHAWSRA